MTSTRLGRVARTISGSGFPPAEQGFTAGDFPFVKVSDLASKVNAHGVVGAANWVTRDQAKSLGAREVPVNSTIFPKVGAALLGNARGRTAVPLLIDNNMMAVVPINLDASFIYWWLRSVDLGELSEGGTLPFVSDTAVRDLRVPVIPVEEQRRIADFLDDCVARIDQIIAARKSQQVSIEARFEAARRCAVLGLSGPTTATNLEWATRVGRDWRVRRLSQLARMGTGHTPSRGEPAYWFNCQIPWLTTSDVHKFRRDQIDLVDATEVQISELGLANSAAVLHPEGTVALSRTASAGFSIVMAKAMATSQDFATWTCSAELTSVFHAAVWSRALRCCWGRSGRVTWTGRGSGPAVASSVAPGGRGPGSLGSREGGVGAQANAVRILLHPVATWVAQAQVASMRSRTWREPRVIRAATWRIR